VYDYDPENRLTKVSYDPTSAGTLTTMAFYRYDALGRRAEAIKYDDSGANAVTTRYYHDGQNVVAEYTVVGGTESPARSYVNGSQYIDERIVMRDHVNRKDFYYLHQELYSEAGLAAANGSLAEAYVYDTYGQARIYQWPTGDFDRDGDVESAADDSGDNTAKGYDDDDADYLTANYSGSGTPTDMPWLDLDADGDADSADLAEMTVKSAPTELAYSAVGNPYLFTGRLTDTYHANSATDVTHIRRLQDNRNRIYDAKHGRWMQHDPLAYLDSANLYEYVRSAPKSWTDPKGESMYFRYYGCWGDDSAVFMDHEKWKVTGTVKLINPGDFFRHSYHYEGVVDFEVYTDMSKKIEVNIAARNTSESSNPYLQDDNEYLFSVTVNDFKLFLVPSADYLVPSALNWKGEIGGLEEGTGCRVTEQCKRTCSRCVSEEKVTILPKMKREWSRWTETKNIVGKRERYRYERITRSPGTGCSLFEAGARIRNKDGILLWTQPEELKCNESDVDRCKTLK
jgi:RHS repeat-associated protein